VGRESRNRQNIISDARLTVAEHRERILGPLLEYDAFHTGGMDGTLQRMVDFRAGTLWYARLVAECSPDTSTELGRLTRDMDAAAGIRDVPMGPTDKEIEAALGPLVDDLHFTCPKCSHGAKEDAYCPGKVATLPEGVDQPCGMFGPHLHTSCKGCGFTFRRKTHDWQPELEDEDEEVPAEPSRLVLP